MMDLDSMLSQRALSMRPSGIRRVFELAATKTDVINFSIGQPDFDVPDAVKRAAMSAIESGHNGYTVTQGIAPLRAGLQAKLAHELDWDFGTNGSSDVLVTSGTSAGLFLSYFTLVNAGDEIVLPDPYFVVYPQLAAMVGATVRYCDTYPDCRMTAERIEPLLTERTKFVLINSPSNPVGVVLNESELRDIVDLCNSRGVIVVSDEVYDEFTYSDGLEGGRFATPARFTDQIVVLRGFSKTYGMTGWRLGYAAGPKSLIERMTTVNQFSFVCAPSMVQHAGAAALGVDMGAQVAAYERKRDLVMEMLGDVTKVVQPAGAFYAFPEVPEHMGLSATEFFEQAAEAGVLVIPGSVFSERDTHFRISFAVSDAKLRAGLERLRSLLSA